MSRGIQQGLVAVGADGCRAGWIAAVEHGTGPRRTTELKLFRDVGELEEWREGHFDDPPVALDVPMGLPPEPGLRPCDREARELLGTRRACVFQPPSRWLFGASDFDEVQRRVRRQGSRGLSQQAFRIMPKVCEVDRFLTWECACQDWLFEAHPEVSLSHLAGRPMKTSKKTPEGRTERLRALSREFPEMRRRVAAAAGRWRRSEVAPDDIVDAYAALWTARRLAHGNAAVLGNCERDGAGLVMRIVA